MGISKKLPIILLLAPPLKLRWDAVGEGNRDVTVKEKIF